MDRFIGTVYAVVVVLVVAFVSWIGFVGLQERQLARDLGLDKRREALERVLYSGDSLTGEEAKELLELGVHLDTMTVGFCDISDPGVGPEMSEKLHDNKDNDCDGLTDELFW